MSGFVKSAPHFLRPVQRTMVACVMVLVALAAVVPAPLELMADPAHPPNPAKSAWFLLWIQELVSHSTFAIYLVAALAVLLVVLPWIPIATTDRAAWCRREHRFVVVSVLLTSVMIAVLTLAGLLCRGTNWVFVSPF